MNYVVQFKCNKDKKRCTEHYGTSIQTIIDDSVNKTLTFALDHLDIFTPHGEIIEDMSNMFEAKLL